MIRGFHDDMSTKPDHRCLFLEASAQHGYFTAAQARDCGLSWDLLSDGAKRGKYQRVRRGLYRLRDYPTAPREEVAAAWLAAGRDVAVVSHESALELLDLSDVIPNAIHLTVPRSKRYLSIGPDVKIHTVSKPFGPLDVIQREGIRVTSATRTILDSVETGTALEQIEMAIWQATVRGLTTRDMLSAASEDRHAWARRFVAQTLQWLQAREVGLRMARQAEPHQGNNRLSAGSDDPRDP
jgi:predicted transcriptional regulator of viral defense system